MNEILRTIVYHTPMIHPSDIKDFIHHFIILFCLNMAFDFTRISKDNVVYTVILIKNLNFKNVLTMLCLK